ncbi:MAG: polyprenyl synthetase family protein, partial [Candidatus Phosphoribacter sp.]
LREGKRTVQLAYALDTSDAGQSAQLAELLGRADLDACGIDTLRAVMIDTGAVQRVEQDITRLADEARTALGDAAAYLEGEAIDVLGELVEFSTARSA